jgi:hypothetical protein
MKNGSFVNFCLGSDDGCPRGYHVQHNAEHKSIDRTLGLRMPGTKEQFRVRCSLLSCHRLAGRTPEPVNAHEEHDGDAEQDGSGQEQWFGKPTPVITLSAPEGS